VCRRGRAAVARHATRDRAHQQQQHAKPGVDPHQQRDIGFGHRERRHGHARRQLLAAEAAEAGVHRRGVVRVVHQQRRFGMVG
jgi:hypothetical protein